MNLNALDAHTAHCCACSLAPINIYDYGEYYEYQIDIINGKLAAETLKNFMDVNLHMECFINAPSKAKENCDRLRKYHLSFAVIGSDFEN